MALKNISTKNLFISLAALAGLIVLICVLYFAFNFSPPYSISNGTPSAENNTEIKDEIAKGPGLPARLIIPSINVDAKIIYVGLDSKGAVDTPKGPAEVAWFKLGPRPGQTGSAVITGHFGPWQTGANSVFDNLHKLKNGDKIYVKDDKGLSLAFSVTDSRIYKPDESPTEVFSKNDGIYLNLITCSGDWLKNQKTYTERRVIFAKSTTN